MLKRMVYMGISGYILQHFNFYRVILQSPHIRHEWFKIGLAATVGEFVFDTRGGWLAMAAPASLGSPFSFEVIAHQL